MTLEFLTLEDVLELHRLQLERFGGSAGLRDQGLLESAIAQPQAAFGGEYLHPEIFEMAAAYVFHVVKNHPFVDGNKRAGLLSALVFLDINGIVIDRGTPELYDLTIAVAEGRLEKPEIAATLKRIAQSP